MSSAIPHSNVTATGPMTRGDFLMMLYWFADVNSIPEVVGVAGLSRLTRLALIVGAETGIDREVQPYFSFYATPGGGVASPELWGEHLGLRAYQIITPLPTGEPLPPEELEERRHMLEKHIPAHERDHYPLPTLFERDVLTNKGTFFAAKREDQTVERRVTAFKSVADLARLSLGDLTARAVSHLAAPASR